MSKELQLILDEMNEEWMKKEAAWNQTIAEKEAAWNQAIAEKDRAMVEKEKESADLADTINFLCTEGRGNESARAMNDRVFREKILREYREAHRA